MKRMPRSLNAWFLIRATVLVGQLAMPSAHAGAPEHTFTMQQPSFAPGDVSFGTNDGINPISGNVNVSAVDLSIPGKNGLNVSFVRSYSSKEFPLRSHMSAVPMVDSPVGLGWTLMPAPEIIPSVQGADSQDIQVRLPDGSLIQMYPIAADGQPGDNFFRSVENWILIFDNFQTPTQLTLFSPTGITYEYLAGIMRLEHWFVDNGRAYWQVPVYLPVSMWDVQKNVVCFKYTGINTEKARLVEVTDSYHRSITLTYAANLGPPKMAPTLQSIQGPTDAQGNRRSMTYTIIRVPWGAYNDQFNQLQAVNNGDFALGFRYSESGLAPAACAQTPQGCPWVLTTVAWPTGSTTSYTYHAETVPTQLQAPWQAFTTMVSSLKTVQGPDIAPRVTVYQYNTATGETIVTDPEGNQTVSVAKPYAAVSPSQSATLLGEMGEVHRYQGQAQQNGVVLQTVQTDYDYKIVGLLPTPPGSDRLFSGLLTRRDVKEERAYFGQADPANLVQRSTNLSWDVYGNIVRAETAGLNAPTRATDTAYKICDALFNTDPRANCGGTFPYTPHIVHGLLTSRTVSDGTGAPSHEEFVINNLGQVTEHTALDTDPQGGDRTQRATFSYLGHDGRLEYAQVWDGGTVANITLYTYEDTPAYNKVTVQDSTDVAQNTSQIVTSRPDGLVSDTTDRNGQQTVFTYTAGGLLSQAQFPKPGSPPQRIDYANFWTGAPPVITVSRGPNSTAHIYNSVLEQWQTTTRTGGTQAVTTVTDRDMLGRAIRVSQPTYKTPASAAQADAYVETIFDALGRPTEQRSVDTTTGGNPTQVTTIAYPAPAVTETTDPAKRLTRAVADGLGRLVALTTPDHNTTTYAYNHLDALTSVSQPGIQARTFSYSPAGLLDFEYHPETGVIAYDYDRLGRRTARTQGGMTIATSYDARGRVAQVTYPDRPADVLTYDGSPCTAFCAGRLSHVTDESGETSYLTYDPHGNLLTKQVTVQLLGTQPPLVYDMSYTYDGLDRLTDATCPSGRTVHYDYDDANRTTALLHAPPGEPLQPFLSQITYHAIGAPEDLTFKSGVVQHAGYDAKALPREVRVTDPAGQKPFQLLYKQYDLANNLKQLDVITKAGTDAEQFDYDDVDRLWRATLPEGMLRYSYDNAGNRFELQSTVKAVPPYQLTVRPGTNQLDEFQYDARGNVIADGKHAYTFTSDNKLRSVDGDEATYTYNAAGQRVRKTLKDGTTYLYHFEGNDAVTTWVLEP